MSIESTANRHLDEAQLVRYMDQEGSREERREWEHHVESCPGCRTDLATLRDQSALVTAWLVRADQGVEASVSAGTDRSPGTSPATHGQAPARQGRVVASPWGLGGAAWLKAAAIVFLVAAPVVAITPAREWVADRLGIAANAPTAAVRSDATPEVASAPAVVSFAPAPGRFSVELDGPQQQGRLTLGRVPAGAEAVFEITGGAPWPEAVVSARGLRLENNGATASYTLLLPPEVDAVRVVIGGRQVQVGDFTPERPTVVPLDRLPLGP